MDYKPDELIPAVRRGAALPPTVAANGGHGFVLIDGVHRTYAHWQVGKQTIEAYEVLS